MRDRFITTRFSIVFNPIYILRHGLFRSISASCEQIEGDVLDFGCGSKPYESLFKRSKSYTGVDISDSGHNHEDSKVDFFWDGKRLPFPDEQFDAVVSFEVLEHVFNLNHVLSELARVLKPDGKLLVTIPFAWGEHEMPFDYARYTSAGIKHELEKSEF